MQSNINAAKVALVMALCSSGWSLASEAPSQDNSEQATPVVIAIPMTQSASAGPVVIPGFGSPLASGQLEDQRGGFDLVKNDMQLSGSVADNSARNFTTGSNHIADGSFTSSMGLPIVIQNSGANVLIQNATIFNLQLQ